MFAAGYDKTQFGRRLALILVKYGIRGIPTLLLFKNGEVAATKVGALSKGQLKEFLDANLA
jgi:thioredoxin 1